MLARGRPPGTPAQHPACAVVETVLARGAAPGIPRPAPRLRSPLGKSRGAPSHGGGGRVQTDYSGSICVGRVDRHDFAARWDVEMFEKFTDGARRVVVLAQEEARMLNHNYIGTEHILLGLIQDGDGVGTQALESLGISLEAARQQVEEIVGRGEKAPTGHIPFTPRAKKVLELSLREAQQLGHNYIGSEHILLGLVREGGGAATEVLVRSGADLDRVRQAVVQLVAAREREESGQLPPVRRGRGGAAGLDEIVNRLDLIAGRLAVIERRLRIGPEAVPHEDLREFDERIAGVRREKESALDDHDFEKAAALHDKEKESLRKRAEKEKELRSAAGEGASAGPGTGT